MKQLKITLAKSPISKEQSAAQLKKVNALELEVKQLKLSTLIAVKNQLTEKQQSELDVYKNENQDLMREFGMRLSEDGDELLVRVVGKVAAEPLYILKEGNKEISYDDVKALKTNQIKSIEVVKGEAAITRFGERGRDGVIIIGMKRP